jgi:peptidoglycan/LPS O-acetylase OafA/YrhL
MNIKHLKNSTNLTSGRLLELDGLRGLASLMVVVYHYTTWYEQSLGYSSTQPIFEFWGGMTGVYLFFMVSGFVIFMSLDHNSRLSHFLISRVARLYPAYWFAVLFTFILLSLYPIPGREVTFLQALVNLTMFQKWVQVPPIDGVYWTLAVELTFYFYMSILLMLNLLRFINSIISLWLALILANNLLILLFGIDVPSSIQFIFFLEYGALFFSGISFYLIYSKRTDNALHTATNLLFSFVLCCLCFQEVSGYIIAFHIVFFLIVKGYGGVLRSPALIFLGSISYSLYLIHQNFGYIVIAFLELNGVANSVSVIVVPIFVSIFISWMIFKFVEVPARLHIKKAGAKVLRFKTV